MTSLIRSITPIAAAAWSKCEKEGNLASAIASPPLWAFREFLPNENDRGLLSVYEVEDDAAAVKVAAAYAFARADFDKGQIVFASAPTEAIRDAGINITSTPGKLNHSAVNLLHRDLAIADLNALANVVKCFLTGDPKCFEPKEYAKVVRIAAKQNEFDCKRIGSRQPGRTNWPGHNLLKIIGESVVVISPGPN